MKNSILTLLVIGLISCVYVQADTAKILSNTNKLIKSANKQLVTSEKNIKKIRLECEKYSDSFSSGELRKFALKLQQTIESSPLTPGRYSLNPFALPYNESPLACCALDLFNEISIWKKRSKKVNNRINKVSQQIKKSREEKEVKELQSQKDKLIQLKQKLDTHSKTLQEIHDTIVILPSYPIDKMSLDNYFSNHRK